MRVAVLSVHSHRDRSFLDDRLLALVAGDLRDAGVEGALVVAFLDAQGRDPTRSPELEALATRLEDRDLIVYERVWSPRVVEALRARLPDATFVACEGEHALSDPPADYVCAGRLRATVPALVRHLRDGGPLPRAVWTRAPDGWREGLGKPPTPSDAFHPDLRPILVGPPEVTARWRRERSFSIEGNAGCPYHADARDNPAFEGVRIPEKWGRGCGFCMTGNHAESAPPKVTADKVLTQLRYVRREAPELTKLVLKDQNPFGWLTEVVERCADEGLGGFSLLLETRADWMMRNRRRFDRALALAEGASIRLCPFLIGIESFSQAELDRFNKGIRAEDNERFLAMLAAWDARHPALDLSHAAFGFVLLTPWTTMEDLRVNLAAVERTGFDRLRGHLLVSRVRLYPETALYYLAARDGLLREAHASAEADSSRRYGYFPGTPWRFVDPRVARFAELAATLTRALGGRDQTRIWALLLDALDAADDPADVTADAIRARLEHGPDDARVRARLSKLLRPLSVDAPFADGWRFGPVRVRENLLVVRLEHDEDAPVALEIVPRGREPGLARSRHYDLHHRGPPPTARQLGALRAVCDAITANDS